MVAPTPVSALLHSSTMVKAGVYLVLRLAPVITGTTVGLMVALVGAVTFVVGSLAAITTSDAKKVLAYSTVANLGLIVLCGGIGTAQGGLGRRAADYFSCAGQMPVVPLRRRGRAKAAQPQHRSDVGPDSEHAASLRDDVDRHGRHVPGALGMLISKWAVLKAVIDASPSLTIFIVFWQRGDALFLGQMDGQN